MIGTNWSGNVAYRASELRTPRSADELAALVRDAAAVKALGSRHCFNSIADTAGVAVSVADLPRDIHVDTERRVLRAPGGLRYGDISAQLDAAGWALPNLASLPHISLAGAVATGTHGSGDGVPSLAASVAGVEIVTADGEVRMVRRGDDDFAGAVVSLGALGIVTALEIDVVPRFEIAQTVYERLPLAAALAHYGEITASGYSVSLFTTWRDPDVIDQVWVKRRADAPDAGADDLHGAQAAHGKRHPLPGVDPLFCTEQEGAPGPWYARLPHFKLEFTPSNGDELQSEYLLPRAHAVAAIEAVRSLASDLAPLVQVCELRTVAADELWLSPAAGAATTAIHFTWVPDQPAVEAFLPRLEAALEPLGARPHWGKLFDVAATRPRLPELYPHWADFAALRERWDPRGVFRNDFLVQLGL